MTTRILPPAEWPRLAGTEAAALWPLLDPAKAQIVVVEVDGAIVATHTLMWVLHAECLWVHPAWRGRLRVLRRLWATVQAVARAMGAQTLATAACDDGVRALLARAHAQPLAGEHFVVTVQGEPTCQQP